MKKDFRYYKESKPFRLWDLAVVGVILIMVVALLLVLFLPRQEAAGVKIYYKGELVRTVAFDGSAYPVLKYNGVTIVIEEGKAYVYESTCKNQYCVKHAPISKSGESIVCLPNQVVVKIYGGEKSEVDEVTK
ncbi:MAG: NusG domain II-containing protein [Clostridia bacterium]|nr:NusG domain II-containing protein [Clostridia bacterium]